MKKNTLQKAVATALVGAMAVSTLAGCNNSSDTNSTTASSKQDQTTTQAASTEGNTQETTTQAASSSDSTGTAGIDGWEPFAEKVTLEIPVYDRGSSGNGCSDVENNYWTQWVQENFGNKYNIDVKYVGITRSDVMTDYSLLAAADSLPTICMEYD